MANDKSRSGRDAESFLRSVVEDLPNMIFIKEATDLSFVLLNRAGAETFGVPVEEVFGKTDYDFFPKEQADFFTANDREVLRTGKMRDIPEEPITTPDGIRWLHTKKIPLLDENGEPRFLVGISEDITEKKRIEEELRRVQAELEDRVEQRTSELVAAEREKLELTLRTQKLESLGELAGGIAHDFNNLLASIMGNITLAQLDASAIGDENIMKTLEITESACLRAKGLTEQLLTFSKGGAPVKSQVSMADLIKEAASLALGGSNVAFEFNQPEESVNVEADEGQMIQVFNNLLINARQAMPSGGKVVVTAKPVRIEEKSPLPVAPGMYISISVTDYGHGISPENLSKVFDPYFTTKATGSGLGLATAHSIVTQHAGHIQIHSTPEIGTTMTVLLPASEEIDVAEVATEQELIPKGNGRVLVMDDDQNVRKTCSRMLSALGYSVSSVTNGNEAVEEYNRALMANHSFDAVILDLTVRGGLGGKEAAEQILEIDPDASLIVSSGYSNDPITSCYQKYGFKEVLAKPYNLKSLSNTVASVT